MKVKVILVEPFFDIETPSWAAERTGGKGVVMYPSVGGAPELEDHSQRFHWFLSGSSAAERLITASPALPVGQ